MIWSTSNLGSSFIIVTDSSVTINDTKSPSDIPNVSLTIDGTVTI